MSSPATRRSDRVFLTLLLDATGRDVHGQEFKAPARTLVINRGGAVILLNYELKANQEIHIQRIAPKELHRSGRARIVREIGRERDGFLYGIEMVEAAEDPWGVEFPDVADTAEAFSKMLLECSYCAGREVVHLNEMELRAFETNRGIARLCRVCRIPSIWVLTPHEQEQKPPKRSSKKSAATAAKEVVADAAEKRQRQRLRLQTRLSACIRQLGSDDELALCEDISPMGLCFRSKRRYEPGEMVDIAVPYSPDSANIFLPSRVVYSEELPKAGMFRHGTEYRKRGSSSH